MSSFNRLIRTRLAASVSIILGAVAALAISNEPPAIQPIATIGVVSIDIESDWRTAQSGSIVAAANDSGMTLRFVEPSNKPAEQIAAVRMFLGEAEPVDAIVITPAVEAGWEQVLTEAANAKIPVFFLDRAPGAVDESLYTSTIANDYMEEGRKAGRALIEITGGKAGIVVLGGFPGAGVTRERQQGFSEVLDGRQEMKILQTRTANFSKEEGHDAMAALLRENKAGHITAVFAHNDDMALGAIKAIEAAGKKPGVDIKIVSIDGVKEAIQAVADGKLNCTVECSPLAGPALIDAIVKRIGGEDVPKQIGVDDLVIMQEQAKEALPVRKY